MKINLDFMAVAAIAGSIGFHLAGLSPVGGAFAAAALSLGVDVWDYRGTKIKRSNNPNP